MPSDITTKLHMACDHEVPREARAFALCEEKGETSEL